MPAGVPLPSFLSPREPRKISFDPRGIPENSAGFPRSPSPCRSLLTTLYAFYDNDDDRDDDDDDYNDDAMQYSVQKML